MSITIFGAIATPHNLPNGTVTSVKITFKGIALKDNTKVEVDFNITPFPTLSFNGSKSDSENFVFSKTIQSFSKTVSIKNSKNPASADWLSDGLIRLNATETATSNISSTYTAIQYK